MWTMDNTDGFTQRQLDLINEVRDEMIADGMDGKNASDIITNAWNPNVTTKDDLVAAIVAWAEGTSRRHQTIQ